MASIVRVLSRATAEVFTLNGEPTLRGDVDKHRIKSDTLPRTLRLLPRRRPSALHGPTSGRTSSDRKFLLERRVKRDYAERRTGFGGGSSEDGLVVGSRSGPCGARSVTGPGQIEGGTMATAPQDDAPHGPSHMAAIPAQLPNAIAMGAKNTRPATMSTPITSPRRISRASITDGPRGVKVRGPQVVSQFDPHTLRRRSGPRAILAAWQSDSRGRATLTSAAT